MITAIMSAAALAVVAPTPQGLDPLVLPPPPATPPASSPPAIADGDLQSTRGGAAPSVLAGVPQITDSALSFQSLSGQVAGNSVTAQSVNSGAIAFNGQALSGYSGIGNFILNTGMNNLLQGSVNVTVNLVGGR